MAVQTPFFEDINGLSDGDWAQDGSPGFVPDLRGVDAITPDAVNDGLSNTNGFISDGNNTLTVQALIYLDTAQSGTTDIINQVKVNSGNFVFAFALINGKLDMAFYNSVGGNRLRSISTDVVPRDQFVVITARVDGTAADLDLFINGVEVSAYDTQNQVIGGGFASGVSHTDNRLAIAARWNVSSTTIVQQTANNRIGAPKLWDVRLGDAEILEDAGLELAAGQGPTEAELRGTYLISGVRGRR